MSEAVERMMSALDASFETMEMWGNGYVGNREGDRLVVDGDIDLRALSRAAIEAIRPELEMARDHIIGSTGARPGSDSEGVVQTINRLLAK